MCLNGLDRDEELLGDFLVLVAASDEPHDLTFTGTESVELLVDHCNLPGCRPKGVQHETGQTGTEYCIAAGNPSNRVGEVLTINGLGDVSTRPCPDDCDHVLCRIRDRQRKEPDRLTRLGCHAVRSGDHVAATVAVSTGQVDVRGLTDDHH